MEAAGRSSLCGEAMAGLSNRSHSGSHVGSGSGSVLCPPLTASLLPAPSPFTASRVSIDVGARTSSAPSRDLEPLLAASAAACAARYSCVRDRRFSGCRDPPPWRSTTGGVAGAGVGAGAGVWAGAGGMPSTSESSEKLEADRRSGGAEGGSQEHESGPRSSPCPLGAGGTEGPPGPGEVRPSSSSAGW